MNSFFDVCDEVGIQMADTFSRILGFKRNLHIGSVPVTVIAPKSKSFSLGKAALLKAELTILMQKAEDGDWGASEETEYIHLQAQLNDCYITNATGATFEGDKVWVDGKHLDPAWPPDQQIWGMMKLKAWRDGIFEGLPLMSGGVDRMNYVDFLMLGLDPNGAEALIQKGMTIADLHEKSLVMTSFDQVLGPFGALR